MKTPALSIIIPVYNAEKFLRKCLDSVLHQSSPSIEIIAVNDGSTDKSLEILEHYAVNYSNIRIFSQPNKGVSAARNFALQQAEREYILFLDADDWLEEDTCKILFNEAKKEDCDIFCFEFTECWEQKRRQSHQFGDRIYLMQPKEVVEKMLKSEISGHCCNKMYRREILQNNHIQFEEGAIYEELLFNLSALRVSQKIVGAQHYLYFYRQQEASQTKNINSLKQLDLLRQTEQSLAFVRKQPDWAIPEQLIKRYFSFIYIQILFLAFKSSEQKAEQVFLTALKENRQDFSIRTLSPLYLFFYFLYKIKFSLARKLFLFLQRCR
jgi:glycosyltransferase involved in cell wall biosynthesis